MPSDHSTASSPSSRRATRSRTVCSFCRQRKVGCDRQLPRCGFCVSNRVECRYTSGNSRPGLRAGYVSQLETRLGELEERVRNLEHGHVPNLEQYTPSDESSQNYAASATHAETAVVHASAEIHQQPSPSATSTGHEQAFTIYNLLSPALAIELCDIWFETYHPWFPILHQPSLSEELRASPDLSHCTHLLTIKAIGAVTITHARSLTAPSEQLRRWSKELRDQVLVEAVEQSSLYAIQALLILSNLECGEGRTSKFWNLIALCKRMTLQLGLRDYVVNQGNDFGGRPTIPPRLLPLPCTIIDREERIRAYWMTELLDSISTLGAGWNSTISPPPDVTAVLPCSDSIWAFPEHIINIWSIGEFHFSSAFSLCIILSTSELWHVHRFLQQSFDLRIYEQKSRFQAESQQIDERLTTWRAEFVAAVYRLINTEHAHEERAEMDPNIILTNCILDGAVIVLFQRLSPCPAGIDAPCDPWPYATNRCIYAADDLAAKLRQASDAELRDVASPNLLAPVFAAARFYLVYAKAVGAELPRNLRVLLRALRVCARRWPRARRFEAVLQTAAAEHQIPVFMSSLPVQFFDPQFSSLEVGDAVVVAAEALEGVLGEGGAGGDGMAGAAE